MKVYLVRHTSVDVPKGISYGQTDVPLKSSFEEEASLTRKNLDGLTFDQVYCSPLSRCTRLAAFCGYPEAIRDARLKELNFGDWEMKSWDEISADPCSRQWFEDWVNVPTPNGESLKQLYTRLTDFLEEIKGRNYRQVCLFTHGGVLATAGAYAGKYALKEAFERVPPFGSVVHIEI